MRIVRNLLILLVTCIGACLIWFHEDVLDYYDKEFGPIDRRPIVATAVSPKGKVRFKLPKTLIYKNTRNNQNFRLRDTITTDSDSSLLLKFNDGLELQVGENSFIVLDGAAESESREGLKISFLRGNFKVLKRGKPGNNTLIKNDSSGNSRKDIVIDPAAQASLQPIVIRSKPAREFTKLVQEKQRLIDKQSNLDDLDGILPNALDSKTDIGDIQKAQLPIAKPRTKTLSQAEEREKIKRIQFKSREEKETLPETYIVDTVQKQKPFFNRCYAQHLRLNPEAQGRIDFSFTISPRGKVIDVRILRASINDPRLHQCTISVLERSEFRSFKGDPVVVNYPVFFE